MSEAAADIFTITAIEAYAYHGVFADEKKAGQPFVVDISYRLDTRRASRNDDLASTVSYAEIAQLVHEELLGGAERISYDLLETLAERIAWRVLTAARIAWMKICLHKPEAPIGVPFFDVTLTIERTPLSVAAPQPRRVLFALGANSGTNPKQQLADAVVELETRIGQGPASARRSSLLRTAALLAPGQAPQPDYYNCAVVVHSALAAEEILAISQQLEAEAGRVRSEHWGQRPLDIDIIAIDGLTSRQPHLQLPHPRASERPFVLMPAAQIAPDMQLGERTVKECLQALPSSAQEGSEAVRDGDAGGGAVLAEVPWP